MGGVSGWGVLLRADHKACNIETVSCCPTGDVVVLVPLRLSVGGAEEEEERRKGEKGGEETRGGDRNVMRKMT